MSPPGIYTWFFALLVVVSFIPSYNAIKCYECYNCPDKDKLTEARECIRSTLKDEYKSFFSSIDEAKPENPPKSKHVDILTCHKIVARNGSIELVMRGCSPYLTPKIKECGGDGHEEKCLYVCEEDECNRSAITLPTTIASCLLALLMLFIV